MANGTIDGKKIKVTGFSIESTENEEIYRVSVSGTPTSSLYSGGTIVSNTAIVRHEKHATITLSGDSSFGPDNNCGTIEINSENIRKDTYTVVSYPQFVEHYEIREEGGKYYLDFCCYIIYDESESGSFVVGGYDIYGNFITSDEKQISNDAADGSSIEIEESSEHIPAQNTDFTLSYTLENIVESSLSANTLSPDITGISFANGEITIEFLPNLSRNFEREYVVSIKGKNEYGDVFYSNEVTIIHDPAEPNARFYLEGEDVRSTATTANFDIMYSDVVDSSTIGVVSWSETITGTPSISGDRVTVTIEENTGVSRKVISVTLSASTVEGKTIFSEGTLFQNPASYILIYGEQTYYADSVSYYTQTVIFPYTSFNVDNIVAVPNGAFSGVGGNIAVNQTMKTVKCTFPYNEDAENKNFEITISGTSIYDENLWAKYVFTQEGNEGNTFKLTSGSTSETGEIEGSTTQFQLNITKPGGYSDIGIYKKESTPDGFISGTSISGNILDCFVYENTTPQDRTYVFQLSGLTPDGRTVFTNEFIATHKAGAEEGRITFTNPSQNVSPESTAATADFTFENMRGVQVSSCAADDISIVEILDYSVTFSAGTGRIEVSFSPYPEATKTITIILSGNDNTGEVRYATHEIIQEPVGECSITVIPSAITLPDNSAQCFSYEVIYENVTSGEPLYDSDVFSGVTNDSACLLLDNTLLFDKQYTIVFRGEKLSGGEAMAELTITQPTRPSNPEITISSNEEYLSGDTYVISVLGGMYPLYVDCTDVDFSTISAVICGSTGTTLSVFDEKIWFEEAPKQESQCSGDTIGYVLNNSVYIPAGNGAENYCSSLSEGITRADQSHWDSGTGAYVYTIEIDPNGEGEYEDVLTEVWLTGTGVDGQPVESNHIFFLQTENQ